MQDKREKWKNSTGNYVSLPGSFPSLCLQFLQGMPEDSLILFFPRYNKLNFHLEDIFPN